MHVEWMSTIVVYLNISICLCVTVSVSLQVPSAAANSGSIEAPVKAVSDWQNYIDDTGNVIEGEDDILLVHDVVWSCDL